MGRRGKKKQIYRVLHIKDGKVYYVQINGCKDISMHHFDKPISYDQYQQEKRLSRFGNNTSKVSESDTEILQTLDNSAGEPNLTKCIILNKPDFETERECTSNYEDETGQPLAFDADELRQAHLLLEGTINTYDPTAFYNGSKK